MLKKRVILPLTGFGLLLALAVILLSLRQDTPSRPLRVCLDPGHGDSDPGAMHPDGRMEKDDNLALALAVRRLLLEGGAEVIMTREDDSNPTIEERWQTANNCEADVFICLHRNNGGGAGVEVWTSIDASRTITRFASSVLSALEDCGIQKNRGVKSGTPADPGQDFNLNAKSHMPSCIIELGFMDNDTDNALFDEHFDAYASAIADAILEVSIS